MKNSIKKSVAVLLAMLMLASLFTVSSFASGMLSYEVNQQGYAEVVTCNKNATGTVVVPTSIKINGTEYEVKTIQTRAFSNCKSIEVITISEGVTQIESKAFLNCTALKTVDIPKSLISCQYDAFEGCNKVTVNCYSSNYQFFTVYGMSDNLDVKVIDSDLSETGTTIFNKIMDVIRKLVAFIINHFMNESDKKIQLF